MKKFVWLMILTALILISGNIAAVQAEILPPHGEGQIGLQAVVLCESLTVRQDRSSSSKAEMCAKNSIPNISSPVLLTLFLPVTEYAQTGLIVKSTAPVSSCSSRSAVSRMDSPFSL